MRKLVAGKCLVIGLLLVALGCGDITVADGDPYAEARRETVQRINQLRATLALPPLDLWTAASGCSDAQAEADAGSGTAHSAFGQCNESAQNECPGWPSTSQIAAGCLDLMWAEGPGSDFATHGHYINMTNTSYHKVSVGFFTTSNHQVWAVMDFAP
jgi:hypothetical protein